MMMKTIQRDGIEVLKEKILLNLRDVLDMMIWNDIHGIRVFRLSSEMFPHITNKKIAKYTLDFCREELSKIGNLSRQLNQRLTFHPGQYNVIGTPNQEAFNHTINDLKYHADVLDLMGLGKDSVIVIHGGGVYGDKNKTITRWCDNFTKLPENVRQRLVLENCEKCYHIEDCLFISEKLNIPVVFDTHHYDCYHLLHPEIQLQTAESYIPAILKTWEKRGIKPKFHVSEQGSGKCGHHSDYIENIPQYLLDIPEKYGVEIDIMIEAKKKELSIFKLYKKYPFLNCKS